MLKNILKSKEFKDIMYILKGISKVSENIYQYPSEKKTFSQKIQKPPKNILPLTEHEEFKKISKLKLKKTKNLLKEKKVPSSSLQRTAILGSTIGSIASSYVFSSLRNTLSFNKKEKEDSISSNEKMPSFMNEKNADMLSETLCRMRGAALKLGQALSIQEDKLIPPFIKDAFEKSRSFAHKMPQYQLESVLKKNLGEDFLKFFEKFDMEPFAAASIGQVHSAVLKNGMKVAVKIQYPGVSKSIDSDIDSLAVLVKYFKILPKSFFFDKFAYNTRKELKEECDYNTEKEKQIKYKNLLKHYKIEKDYIVPDVIEELSKKNILITEFKEGLTIDEVAENAGQIVKDYLGKLVLKNTIEELFLMNYMQTDPNFSNYFYDQKENKLIIIDFGAARSYNKEFCKNYEEVIKAGAYKNKKKMKDYSIKLGFLTGEESSIALNAHCDALIAVADPFFYEGMYDFGSQKITDAVYVQMPKMMKSRLKEPPSEVYSLHRKLSGAYLICIKLGARVNVRKIFYDVLEKKKVFEDLDF